MTKRSEAYGDYRTRLRQATRLLRHGKASSDATLAAACSKGAVVLAAAALERFMNDVIAEACRRLNVATWAELSEGHRTYFADQMARRLRRRVNAILDEGGAKLESERTKLQKAVALCTEAFSDPSKWPHSTEFGMFMDGAAAPNKINGILRSVHRQGADFFTRLENHPLGKSVFLSGLTELIDARHAAAHALPDRADPSPGDAQAWLILSFWLAREIDIYLDEGTPQAPMAEQQAWVGLPAGELPLKAAPELPPGPELVLEEADRHDQALAEEPRLMHPAEEKRNDDEE